MCWTASSDPGPRSWISPMWLTSKTPTPVRTAMCSAIRPEYSTGMSQPPKSTIFAPMRRCMTLRAVLRSATEAGVATAGVLPAGKCGTFYVSTAAGPDGNGRPSVGDHVPELLLQRLLQFRPGQGGNQGISGTVQRDSFHFWHRQASDQRGRNRVQSIHDPVQNVVEPVGSNGRPLWFRDFRCRRAAQRNDGQRIFLLRIRTGEFSNHRIFCRRVEAAQPYLNNRIRDC